MRPRRSSTGPALTAALVAALVAALIGVPALSVASPADGKGPSLARIKKHYRQVTAAIRGKALYENRYVVNRTGRSWRAVGNHKVTVSWYYGDTLGETEKHLRLVAVTKSYAASSERLTCLYLAPCDADDPEKACKALPVFCHDRRDVADNESAGPTDNRYYWSAGRLIQLRRGKARVDKPSAIDRKQAGFVYQRALGLRARFARYETL